MNPEEEAALIARLKKMSILDLSIVRCHVDTLISQQKIELEEDPRELLKHHFEDMFSTDGTPSYPTAIKGGVLVGTYINYGRGESHECSQVTIRENRASVDEWIWDSESLIDHISVSVGNVTKSLYLVESTPGQIIGTHPMTKKKVKNQSFAAHTRHRVEFHEIRDIMDDGTADIKTVYDIEASKLPEPRNV